MGRVIVRQDNGLFAIWSSIVDNFVWTNCTREEVFEVLISDTLSNMKLRIAADMRRVDRTGTSSRHQPPQLVGDLLDWIKEIHGQEERDKVEKQMREKEQDSEPDEAECAHMFLDDQKVPREDAGGNGYSLVGRIGLFRATDG